MSPVTHLLGSWIVAACTTDDLRERRWITLAGLLPDADGLGLVVDLAKAGAGCSQTYYYAEYHHYLLHNLWAGLMVAGLAAALARRRWRVGLAALGVFHLHLLCDLLGSRGPAPTDLWPIFYLAPLSRHPMWVWQGQWRLDSWPNALLSLALLGWALWLAIRHGESFVAVFSRRADAVFVGVLRKWWGTLSRSRKEEKAEPRA